MGLPPPLGVTQRERDIHNDKPLLEIHYPGHLSISQQHFDVKVRTRSV